MNVGGDICVASFNKRTGELLWKTEHDWQASYASPVPAEINGQKQVMVLTGGMVRPPVGGLLRIDPRNGRIEASIPWRAQMFASVNAASPVLVGNCVFITEAIPSGLDRVC